jgi:acetylornithine deacetylase
VNPDYPGGNREELLGGGLKVNECLAEEMENAAYENHWVEKVEGRKNLVSVGKGSGGGKSLIFNGHVDTVIPVEPDKWKGGSPWTAKQEKGLIYGLGATDMKGPIAVQCKAAQALKSAGIQLKGDLMMQWTCGEETHQPELGPTACIEAGFKADGAIVSESSTVNDQLYVMPVSPGVLHAKVTVPGKSAHCCARHEAIRPGGKGEAFGVNAIEKAMFIIQQVQRLETEWGMGKSFPLFKPGFFTLNPGYIKGGPGAIEAPYALADHCLVEYLITFCPAQTCKEVMKEFEQYIKDVCKLDSWLAKNPPKIEWVVEWEPFSTDKDDPFVQAVHRAHQAVEGKEVPLANFHAVCDATYYQEKGIPSVVYGPGNVGCAHSLNEHIGVEVMKKAAKGLALAAVEWCDTEA